MYSNTIKFLCCRLFVKAVFILSLFLGSYGTVGIGAFLAMIHIDAAYAQTQSIVAVVNDDVITQSDLSKRIRLVTSSSGLPPTAEVRQKITQQILANLINEQIMFQEANRFNFSATQEEIEEGFAQIAKQNQKSPQEFTRMLEQMGVDLSTMERQIEAQILWGKVVQHQLRPRVVISERDIDDALSRIEMKIGTTEYFVAEIYLPFGDAEEKSQVRNLANELVREVRNGKASFFKLAQQFSQAAGAANGGNKGWVNEAELSDPLLNALKNTGENQVTNPVEVPNGYHILLLRDKRTLSEDTVPSREQIRYNMGTARMDRMQRQYLMDLRLASYIDIRL
ncbi:MAG: peptidylprolyl isomerase [Alphaproteobacteria bacterium]